MQIDNIYQGANFSEQINTLISNINRLNTEIARTVSKEIIVYLVGELKEQARKRAPIDTGALEASIQLRTAFGFTPGGGSGYSGFVFVSSGSKAGEYAEYMHEFFYDLGPKSRQKQAGQAEIVGRKYLERALKENVGIFDAYIIGRLEGFFKNGY